MGNSRRTTADPPHRERALRPRDAHRPTGVRRAGFLGNGFRGAGFLGTVLAAVTAATIAATAAVTAPAVAAPSPTPSLARADVERQLAAQGIRLDRITVDDGVALDAYAMTPSGKGPFPLVVFTTSWSTPNIEYIVQARRLVKAGYAVVSYTPRGFYTSGGKIDVAGPAEVGDVSKVIDWTLKNVPADPKRIAAGGISYGAGISLLAAASDKRIRAVLAMSGWTDLLDSLYGNRTRHVQATTLLTLGGLLTGRPGEKFKQITADYYANRNYAGIAEYADQRSALSVLDGINRNKPAIFMANGFGDSIFPPNQVVKMFQGLKTPKRLQFAPGDHTTVEIIGLLGFPNYVWNDASVWLSQHLNGTGGTGDSSEVVIRPKGVNAQPESARDWESVAGERKKLALGDGEKLGGESGSWTKSITADVPTLANAGVAFLTSTLDQLTGIPPLAPIAHLPRSAAGVWVGGESGEVQRIRGMPRLNLTVTPSAEKATFVSYLYDVGPSGVGKLITHMPYTMVDAKPGQPKQLSVDLNATGYDLPAGHKLAVAVDSMDTLYLDENAPGAKISFSGSDANKSTLELPIK